MSLVVGTRIGPYEIFSALGAGGMGEVYRARDSKLNRDVAIKVLLPAVANDPDRLARFSREAQVLASLNHPNIAAIYGIEESNGVTALVMELVEGEDLSQRIARGAIPIDEALPIARQIAEALEAAHDCGIVHRDLKPANIKLRADGAVKVLDFGLAKAVDPTAGSSATAMNSPTLSVHATEAGIILGTAAYMSPEQARGKAIDKRTDIWAFGAVLFEMLTGKRAFPGDDATDTIIAVCSKDPDWTLLPSSTPPRIRELLHLCLEKSAKQRRSDAADVRIDLEQAGKPAEALSAVAPQPAPRLSLAAILGAAVILAAGVTTGRIIPRGEPSPLLPAWMSLLPPPPGFATRVDLAVSPDGRTVAFIGKGPAGEDLLWLRAFDALAPRSIPGSEGALQPFWSPDGNWLGFFARGKLKKVPVSGGTPQALADAPSPRGGTWNARGDILFVPFSFAPIQRTTAAGGPPAPVSTVAADGTTQERHAFPHFLPDGRHFLFTRGDAIVVGTLDSAEVKEIAPIASTAEYANGQLLFVRDGNLFAQPFDAGRLALNGGPVKLADNIGWTGEIATAFAFSASNGVLAYWDRSAAEISQLTWFDRGGKTLAILGEPGEYLDLALSPDARHVAVEMHETRGGRVSVWLMDAATGARSRFTQYRNWTALPLWSADSNRVLVTDFSDQLHILPVAGGTPQNIPIGRGVKWPTGWSKDGRFIVFSESRETFDLGIVTAEGRAPVPFLQTPFNEARSSISPDGSWLAYQSDEAGRNEIFVQAFPGAGRKLRVSTSGGEGAVWRADGRALFYQAASGELIEAELAPTTTGLEVRAHRSLFRLPHLVGMRDRRQYAVTADGQRFLFNAVVPDVSPRAITVVLNWNAGLQK